MRFEMEPHVRHLLSGFATPTKIMTENANLARDNLPQTLLSMPLDAYTAVATAQTNIQISRELGWDISRVTTF